jgi:PucR C-terminal helix-turn-helix domain
MIKTPESEPWHALPPALADAIEPELPKATEEILETIGREVPEYARPLEGAFGVAIRTGVTEALRQFVELIRDPAAGREPGRDVYVGLGRAEHREGRTLDSLQSAYRVGARVAWRRVSAAARRRGADPEELGLLAEAIFAYIDELSADSVEGYAQAQREQEGERQRRRRELLALLLRDPPAPDPEIRSAAQAAGWRLPRSGCVVAVAEADLARLAQRLPADALVAPSGGQGCAIVSRASRGGELERAAKGLTAAVGPAVPRAELADSWRLASTALRAAEARAIDADGLIQAEQHLAELLLFESGGFADRLAERRLAPLEDLTPVARSRMEETALAYVQHGGNAAAMARALHLHPQTIRYRLTRLRELFGDQLEDPDARFELELALRAGRIRGTPTGAVEDPAALAESTPASRH